MLSQKERISLVNILRFWALMFLIWNLLELVEINTFDKVAAMVQAARQFGYDSADDLNKKLLRQMNP